MSANDGGPAFPIGSGDMRDPCGMSLRQWYAGQALAGLLANDHINKYDDEGVARLAFKHADALIAAEKAGAP